MALVVAAASAAPIEDRVWRVELPASLTAAAPASNVETSVFPWLGVRVGRVFNVDNARFLWGVDGALWAGQARDGTPDVASTRTIAFLEGRAWLAPARVATTFSAFLPYGFAGLSAGGGLAEIKAFDDVRQRPVATWAARVGGGAELRIHALSTRLEAGIGLRELRPETSASFALGLAF